MEQLQFENAKGKRIFFKEQAIERMGQTKLNNYNTLMTVDMYNNSADVWVRFIDSGYMVNTTWSTFISGSVKSPYDRSVFGVGYIGDGKYKPSVNGVITEQYKAWSSMMARCYSEKFHEKNQSYIGCIVTEEWHNFQTFAKWYDENYYEIEGARMNLDKDILVKGNKIYSPETCVFVPHFINVMFVNRKYDRGNLPVGVKICSRNHKKYESQCRNNTGKRNYLGCFDTPEDAFNAYKTYKEATIKKTAEEHKDGIPNVLYNAMINYKIEITD